MSDITTRHPELFELQKFVQEANQSNSITDKKRVIGNYPQCQPLWKYVYDTINLNYGVTSTNLKKLSHMKDLMCSYNTITELLDALSKRLITGHNAIAAVNGFIALNPQYEDLIFNIIDRNLKTRTDAKLINDVFPGAIPQWEVALAEAYKPDKKGKLPTINFEDGWYGSRKLDGCRCITMIDEVGNIRFVSRNGKDFDTLGFLAQQVRELGLRNMVLDGEVCIIDSNGNEDFQTIMKYIRRKDYTIPNAAYCIFDMIPKADFERQASDLTLEERYENLRQLFVEDKRNRIIAAIAQEPTLMLLDQIKLEDKAHLDRFFQHAQDNGWEGLILRRNVPYEGKRSKNMLKVKKFHDAEFVVKRLVNGPIRYIDTDANGNTFENEAEMLSKAVIEFKGNEVGVGSGWSLDQRKHYYAHPEDLIGMVITVEYFSESEDENGNPSLRFPVVKVVHGKEREV